MTDVWSTLLQKQSLRVHLLHTNYRQNSSLHTIIFALNFKYNIQTHQFPIPWLDYSLRRSTCTMRMFTAPGIACLSSQFFTIDNTTCFSSSNSNFPLINFPKSLRYFSSRSSSSFSTNLKASPSSLSPAANLDTHAGDQPPTEDDDDLPQRQISSKISNDWEMAKSYMEKGLIYRGMVDGFNGGGLLVRFQSLMGFLPFPLLSPYHYCKDPEKSIREIAKGLRGSSIVFKVIKADEENRKLIFSEKEVAWSNFSPLMDVGDVFEARVGVVEDYGAFLHLRFPDGCYHVTGLVPVSEVSWDSVQSARDVLTEGDNVRAKIIGIDREKARVTLSLRQMEEDPILQTLDKVIPLRNLQENGWFISDSSATGDIEPLPGLEMIIEELLEEDGINDIQITRQGFEKRVVSPDLQLWLSNAPPIGDQFTLLARAGRQVQEIQMTTGLDKEGIKQALQRALERVP